MLKARNADPRDGISYPFRHHHFHAPDADTNLVVESVDLSAAAAGDSLTVATGWLPVPMSLFLTMTDAAGGTLTATVTIYGNDQFGVPIQETIALGAGSDTVHTAKVFARVRSVTLDAIANNAASDTLIVGISAASTSIKYGLPVHVTGTTVGADDDSVKSVFLNGAVQTGITIQPQYSCFTGLSVAADAVIQVQIDPSLILP